MQDYHRGQNLTEYGLALALVALVCVGGLQLLGGGLNKGFSGILPSSWSSPALKTKVSNVSTNTPPATNDIPMLNNTVLQNAQASGLSGSSDPALAQYNNIVLTTGSLGDDKVIFDYSDQLVAIAQKYEQTDPALFNQIVALGMLGKKMAISVNSFQQSPSSQMNGSTFPKGGILDSEQTYLQAWNAVMKSSDYASLSSQDQAQVSQLVTASDTIVGDVWNSGGKVVNASTTVDQNSNQIVTCGQNMACQ